MSIRVSEGYAAQAQTGDVRSTHDEVGRETSGVMEDHVMVPELDTAEISKASSSCHICPFVLLEMLTKSHLS